MKNGGINDNTLSTFSHEHSLVCTNLTDRLFKNGENKNNNNNNDEYHQQQLCFNVHKMLTHKLKMKPVNIFNIDQSL